MFAARRPDDQVVPIERFPVIQSAEKNTFVRRLWKLARILLQYIAVIVGGFGCFRLGVLCKGGGPSQDGRHQRKGYKSYSAPVGE